MASYIQPLLEKKVKEQFQNKPEVTKIIKEEVTSTPSSQALVSLKEESKPLSNSSAVVQQVAQSSGVPAPVTDIINNSLRYWDHYFTDWASTDKKRKARIAYKKELLKRAKERKKQLTGAGKKIHGRSLGSIFRDAFMGPVGWIRLGIDMKKNKEEEKLDKALKEAYQGHTVGRARGDETDEMDGGNALQQAEIEKQMRYAMYNGAHPGTRAPKKPPAPLPEKIVKLMMQRKSLKDWPPEERAAMLTPNPRSRIKFIKGGSSKFFAKLREDARKEIKRKQDENRMQNWEEIFNPYRPVHHYQPVLIR